jgi:hypothetical protein
VIIGRALALALTAGIGQLFGTYSLKIEATERLDRDQRASRRLPA